ncbi:MAG: hypothetical protein U0835_02710 [Isosphaeraceae bacterium]
MSRFFIERPILANVIAIVTMIIGSVAAGLPADRAVPEHHAAENRAGRQSTPGPTRGSSPTPSPR